MKYRNKRIWEAKNKISVGPLEIKQIGEKFIKVFDGIKEISIKLDNLGTIPEDLNPGDMIDLTGTRIVNQYSLSNPAPSRFYNDANNYNPPRE